MGEIVFSLTFLALAAAAIAPLLARWFKPADQTDRAFLSWACLAASVFASAATALVYGLLFAENNTSVLAFSLGALLLGPGISYLSLRIWSAQVEKKLKSNLDEARKLSGFALANYGRLDLEGEDYLSVWTLSEVQRIDNWKPDEIELIKTLSDKIESIGHKIGVMNAPAAPFGRYVQHDVYNICRADLESYLARCQRKLWDWQHGSWLASLS